MDSRGWAVIDEAAPAWPYGEMRGTLEVSKTGIELEGVAPLADRDGEPVLGGFFKQMLDGLYDGVYFVNNERRILYWNAAAERISGYSAAEVLGRVCTHEILQHTDENGCELRHDCCPLADTLRTRKPNCSRMFLRHKSGNRIAVEVRVSPVSDGRGRILGAVQVFRDAAAQVELESAYNSTRELASKDPLTGLANRRSLETFVSKQLALAVRAEWDFSMILLDIDGFKAVNDTFGHAAGDRVLLGVGRFLHAGCREMDLAGRFGGDEFSVVLPNTEPDQAALIAERIRMGVQRLKDETPTNIPAVTASMGVANYRPGDDWDSLLSRADAALYEAKRNGRNRVQLARGQSEPLAVPLP